ncbi:MAG TPA: hypothetical protein VGF24_30910 [Vicinamibacterales bacterium]|jgi:hypothetical protein
MEPTSTGRHVTDEDLLLDYYGESAPADRDERRAHLDACESCRALDREMRAVLTLVDTTPAVEAPPGFGREMWARIEPEISARMRPRTPWWRRIPSELLARRRVERWALAGGMAALLVAAFMLGRVWEQAPRRDAPSTDARTLRERLLQAEVEDHLDRSQRVLVDLVNADDTVADAFAGERMRAADLVAAGRLYRRSADAIGDVEMRDLLEDVERILVDVANEPSDGSSKDLTDVRMRITEQDLVFRLRLAASEIRERERRARPVW